MRVRQQGRSLVVHTPAKLNLFLEVLGKRADGYHELETLMVSVGLYDTLRFTAEPDFANVASSSIQLSAKWAGPRPDPGPPLTVGEDNLVVRAARLLQQSCGVVRGVRVELTKRIPWAAGLAGGSSDAAATLVALNRLWELQLTDQQLMDLAARLGSDIGYFLARSPAAVCRGRGELIEAVALHRRFHFVIAKPRSGLSTAEVFRHCDTNAARRSVESILDAVRTGPLCAVGRCLHNALQTPAERLNPEAARLQQQFSELRLPGHSLTGSGSAYFGLCSHRVHARRVAAELRRRGRLSVWVASMPA